MTACNASVYTKPPWFLWGSTFWDSSDYTRYSGSFFIPITSPRQWLRTWTMKTSRKLQGLLLRVVCLACCDSEAVCTIWSGQVTNRHWHIHLVGSHVWDMFLGFQQPITRIDGVNVIYLLRVPCDVFLYHSMQNPKVGLMGGPREYIYIYIYIYIYVFPKHAFSI